MTSQSTQTGTAFAPLLQEAIQQEAAAERRTRVRDTTLAVLTPIVLLAAWEISARTGAIDGRIFTPPSAIVQRALEMLADGSLLHHTWATIKRLLMGFLSGAAAGIIVGLIMGVIRPIRAALGPTFTALYALPKIAILPLLLLIFGLTETPKILSVAISVFFVLQINTLAGIMQIDQRILEAAKAYLATGLNLFRHVLLPGALPTIFTGIRVAAGQSVIVVTSVEFVASNDGLGYLIWNSWQLFQPSTMYVGLVVVSIVGALMTFFAIKVEQISMPWKYTSRKKGTKK